MTTVRQCARLVSRVYNVTEIDLVSPGRSRRVAGPRQIVYWLARETAFASYTKIARILRRGDHTTIVYGVRRVEERRAADPVFRAETDYLRALLMPADIYGEAEDEDSSPQLQLIPGGLAAGGERGGG